jgi:hypothetical protein
VHARPEHLIVGDLRETLPGALRLLPGPGGARAQRHRHGGRGAQRPRRAWLAGALPPLLQAGAVVASDQRLDDPRLEPLPLPAGLSADRYFLYVHAAKVVDER